MANITAKTKLCLVVGDPIEHSLSPHMHNAGYAALGIASDFVYLAAQVKIDAIEAFVKGIRALGIRGVSCTIPHKSLVIPYLDEIDETAMKIGAVNTIVNDTGKLTGYNTDWLGIVDPLQTKTTIGGKHVALLGAGGAARAVLYGIQKQGGRVTIFNRTRETAEKLAKDFNSKALPLDDLAEIKNMDIIFNATSVGMHPSESETPLAKEYIMKHHIVFDAVYNPLETRLLREAKEQGATIIYGYEMLLHQGAAQFELFTGKPAPVDIMRETLMKHLN
jgi:shikimate dehydrogenase